MLMIHDVQSPFWMRLIWTNPEWCIELQLFAPNCCIQSSPCIHNNYHLLLMEEILHHLGCIKPCKKWDNLPIKWCRISSINSITIITSLSQNHRYRYHHHAHLVSTHKLVIRTFEQDFLRSRKNVLKKHVVTLQSDLFTLKVPKAFLFGKQPETSPHFAVLSGRWNLN